MAAVVNVREENLELDDVSAEPIHGQPTEFSWHNISFDRKTDGRKSGLFSSGLSGTAEAGRLFAILGPSGAGKSILLNVLGQKIAPSAGEIRLDGFDTIRNSRGRQRLRRLTAYVEQDIPLIDSLSVKETLEFAHRLAIPSAKESNERRALVSKLLCDLDLTTEMSNKRIGSAWGGDPRLSGGEQKRLGIATQLVTQPAILLLDEPTSGLDSFTALAVILRLKDIARNQGMIILASIQQPSNDVFEAFDDLLLLHKSGRQLFSGCIAESTSITRHLCPETWSHANQAEQLLQVATQPCFAIFASHDSRPTPPVSTPSALPSRRETASTVDQIAILYTLVHRGFLKAFRDATAYAIRAVMILGLALLVGTVWLRLEPTDRNAQSFINAIFFGGAFMSLMAVASIPAFLEDKAVFQKERADGLYGPSLFVLSNFLVGLPFLLSFSVLFSSVAYWLCNFRPSLGGYCSWILWLFLDLVAAESLAVLVSSAVPIFVASLTITALWNGIWMCTGGFMVHGDAFKSFWKYVFHYIDYQAYVFQGMMVNEFERRVYSCVTSTDDSSRCSCVYENPSAGECSISGRHILQLYDIGSDGLAQRLASILGIIAVLRTFGWLVLRLRR